MMTVSRKREGGVEPNLGKKTAEPNLGKKNPPPSWVFGFGLEGLEVTRFEVLALGWVREPVASYSSCPRVTKIFCAAPSLFAMQLRGTD